MMQFVVFKSHRARDTSERLLGTLSDAWASLRHEDHYYPMQSSDVDKIKKIKGVVIRSKMPGLTPGQEPDSNDRTWRRPMSKKSPNLSEATNKKVKLDYRNFKNMVSGSSTKLIQFLTAQKIGKIEFVSKPWTLGKGQNSITKWVIDLEKNKFIKLVNGEVDHEQRITVGDAIGEISDLITNETTNDYSSVYIYKRTSIPGKSDTFSNESFTLRGIFENIKTNYTDRI